MGYTPLKDFIAKAAFTTADLEGGSNGGMLSNEQARQFLRDAIEETAVFSRADVFDSSSPKFEIPKISLASRVMKKRVQATRLDAGKQAKPETGLVTLSTEFFGGEVVMGDEVFEDNVEREQLADTLMAQVAEAVGRDLEEIGIKSNETSTTEEFALLEDGGLVQQLVDANENVLDASGVGSYKSMFRQMVHALPTRYRRTWDRLAFFVNPTVADGYADELGDRATILGDTNVDQKAVQRYRSIPVYEVPLLSGEDTIAGPTTIDYSTFAWLTIPTNVKVGFHRRVRIEKFRDPREGATSWIPTVRMDTKWAQPEACVFATGVPDLAADE